MHVRAILETACGCRKEHTFAFQKPDRVIDLPVRTSPTTVAVGSLEEAARAARRCFVYVGPGQDARGAGSRASTASLPRYAT